MFLSLNPPNISQVATLIFTMTILAVTQSGNRGWKPKEHVFDENRPISVSCSSSFFSNSGSRKVQELNRLPGVQVLTKWKLRFLLLPSSSLSSSPSNGIPNFIIIFF